MKQKRKEDRLQYECIKSFSEKYPNQRGRLFAVRNDAKNNKDAIYAKSIGVYPGVSDLLYQSDDGKLLMIELKEEGSTHDVFHVQRQAEWMNMMEQFGHLGMFVTSLESFHKLINGDYSDSKWCYVVTKECLSIIKKGKKTIKF